MLQYSGGTQYLTCLSAVKAYDWQQYNASKYTFFSVFLQIYALLYGYTEFTINLRI